MLWTLASLEPVNAGFLSLLPPLVALVLAFITKEVITSILSGVFVGTIIYTIKKHMPWYNAISIVISLLVEKMSEEMEMIIFITLLGGLIIIMKDSGGSRAYGMWAIQRVKSRIGTEFSAMFMSFLFFVDDYFNCLTTSTVLKPLARSNSISMEKLAFIIHAIANNICLLVPFSSWAAAIASNIKDAGLSGGLSVFIRCIPYNFYPVLIIFFVFLLIVFDVDYGSMRRYEELSKLRGATRAKDAESIMTPRNDDEKEGSVWDLIVPIVLLIGFTFLFMLCTGGYFTDPKLSILQAFMEGDAVLSLSMSCLSTLLCCALLLVPRKQMSFNAFVESVKEGAQYMAPTIIILAVAWTMSGVTNELLGTGEYLGMLITRFRIPVALLPTVFFLLVAVTAFALGNAWCCFGIFIPIASKICTITPPESLVPTLAAGISIANEIAPEHLELCVDEPFTLLGKVKNAGSIFLGRRASEALGDYFAGPNHTLPTSGTARFSSPLSVDDFVKKSSFLYYSEEALRAAAPRVADFAEREGLRGHARSVSIRTEEAGK